MNEFDLNIQKVIEERVSVLFEIEKSIFTKRYSLSKKHQDIFSKQSISMIYSIWEGFVQKAFNLYIDEINRANIAFYNLCDKIVVHHMENAFKQFKEYPSKDSGKIRFFTSLKGFHANDICSISRVVNTESNVGFNTLNRLLTSFSLETFPEHWRNYTHPDPSLKESMDFFLKLRNTVAHGGDLLSEDRIDQEVYIRFKQLMIDLMYNVRIKMLEGLENKTFLKINDGSTGNDPALYRYNQ